MAGEQVMEEIDDLLYQYRSFRDDRAADCAARQDRLKLGNGCIHFRDDVACTAHVTLPA